jgi:hypothetical protein
MPASFELGLMVNLYSILNKGSLVLEPVARVPPLFFPFCLKTAPGTWISVGEISQAYHRHTHLRSPTQALHNIDYAFMTTDKVNKSELAAPLVSWTATSLLCVMYSSGMMVCAPFYLTLFDSWVWMSFNSCLLSQLMKSCSTCFTCFLWLACICFIPCLSSCCLWTNIIRELMLI